MPDYTSLRATTETADALRGLTVELTIKTRKRVTQMDALRAAIAYATDHADDVAARLGAESETDPQ